MNHCPTIPKEPFSIKGEKDVLRRKDGESGAVDDILDGIGTVSPRATESPILDVRQPILFPTLERADVNSAARSLRDKDLG